MNGAKIKASMDVAAPVMYMSPIVFASANKFKKLELEYTGIEICSEKMNPITVIV
jgi:hypothetical protein